ncbi:MAG: DUF523 domain-containing protein [Lachnospiraceae bacterium]|nr:DUF523 domain-containing protein [Lachnospiraceae bacterium]
MRNSGIKENVLISACLLGVHCRYDGNGNEIEQVDKLREKYNLIPVCPEVYGGLATPRDPAERKDDKVVTKSGADVTEQFVRGAKEVMKLAKFYDCHMAILKERSPSCGSGMIYDGTFSRKLVAGDGMLAEQLKEIRMKIVGESQI